MGGNIPCPPIKSKLNYSSKLVTRQTTCFIFFSAMNTVISVTASSVTLNEKTMLSLQNVVEKQNTINVSQREKMKRKLVDEFGGTTIVEGTPCFVCDIDRISKHLPKYLKNKIATLNSLCTKTGKRIWVKTQKRKYITLDWLVEACLNRMVLKTLY